MQRKKVRNWKGIGGTIAVILAFGIVIFACIYSIVNKSNNSNRGNSDQAAHQVPKSRYLQR